MTGSNYLSIGRLTKGHGLKGEIRVIPLVDTPEVLEHASHVRAEYPDGRTAVVKVDRLRQQGDKLLVTLAGVIDRNGADALRGVTLSVDREELPPPLAEDYFLNDLIGYRAVSEDGQQIGEVIAVMEIPANPVLTLWHDDREIMIPLVEQIVTGVNHEEKVITIFLLEGLLDQ